MSEPTSSAKGSIPSAGDFLGLRRPRILQVSAFFAAHGGGIEAVADTLARHLAASGAEIIWMAGGTPNERPVELPANGFTTEQAVSIDPIERSLGIPFPVWGFGSVVRLWHQVGRADIVHLHDYLYMPTLVAAICARLRRKPVVLTQHIGDIPFSSSIAHTLLKMLNHSVGTLVLASACQVIFVSRSVQDYFQAFVRFRRAPRLIANGVDSIRYHPVTREAKQAGPVKLLFVGRFVEKKGIALLRHCVSLPGTRWTFVGRGPIDPSDWNIPTADTRILGAMRAEQVVPHYQQADLLVLPSTGEGFPLVVQEALACGTPVLVSREVAEAFPIKDERCVFDVELRVPEPAYALRDAVRSLVKAPGRLASARPHAQVLATQWSWESCSQQYRAIYDEQLAR